MGLQRKVDNMWKSVKIFFIFVFVVGMVIWFLKAVSDDNIYNCAQAKWVRAHSVGVAEINGRDTVWICNNGVLYHIKPYIGGK